MLPRLSRSLFSPTNNAFLPKHCRNMSRKAGVLDPSELREFVAAAGSLLLVIDVRNPDVSVELGDQKSLAVASLPAPTLERKHDT